MSEPLLEQPFNPAEPEPVAPEPEPFQISQEDWQQQQETSQYILGQLQQLATLAQPQDPAQITLPEDSLLTPADLEVIAQLFQQQIGPIEQTREQWMQSQGNEAALDIIADDVSTNGDFLLEGSKQKARDLSENYYPQYAAHYGPGSDAAEAALRQACNDVREWEAEVGRAFMEREQNQLATLAGAPRSPAVPGRPAQQQLTGVEGGNEFSVLKKYFPNGNQ